MSVAKRLEQIVRFLSTSAAFDSRGRDRAHHWKGWGLLPVGAALVIGWLACSPIEAAPFLGAQYDFGEVQDQEHAPDEDREAHDRPWHGWLQSRQQVEWNSIDVLVQDRLVVQRRETQALSSAWFMEGRMLMRAGQLPQAVKRFQRAWRYSPAASDAAHHLLFLLLQLERDGEAVRYARLIDPRSVQDGEALLDLAGLLTDEEDDAQAIQYYRQWLERFGPESNDAMRLLVLMEIGRLSYLLDEYEAAADAFEGVLEASRAAEEAGQGSLVQRTLFADPQTTLALIGECFFMAQRWKQAEDVFELAFASEPTAPAYQLWQARLSAARGDADLAQKQLQNFFESPHAIPDEAAFELLYSLLRQQHPTNEQAFNEAWRSTLEKLLEEGKGITQTLKRLADAASDTGDDQRAMEYLERLRRIAPNEVNSRALAALYIKHQRYDQLVDLYASIYAVRRDLDWIDAERTLFVPDSSLAKRILDEWNFARIQNTEDDSDVAMVLAIVACRHGDTDAARQYFEMAQALSKDRATLDREWTVELLSEEAYLEAVYLLEQRVRDALDEDVEAQFLLAGAYVMTDQPQRAREAAQVAFERLPSSVVVRNRLAWVLQRQGDLASAGEIYESTLDEYDRWQDSVDQRNVLRLTRMGSAAVAAEQGRVEEAEEYLLTVLEEFPDDATALNDLGFLWAEHDKHLELACQMIRRAVAQEPDNGAYLDSLGWVLFRLDRFEESIAALDNATRLEPEDPDFWEHLGDVYEGSGRGVQACTAWRTAQRCLQPDHQKARQRLQQKINASASSPQ